MTGHSLGGAGIPAIMATRALNSDHLAACYTFGSPKVGNEEFDDDIKPPIYRVVHAFDIVPFSPPTYLLELLSWLPFKKLQGWLKEVNGYAHHGDMRFLTVCKEDFSDLDVICNYNEFLRLWGSWRYRKDMVKHHEIDTYCEKLGQWALGRV